MGLLGKIFRSNKSITTQNDNRSSIGHGDHFLDLELTKLQNENARWDNEFNNITSLRQVAKQFEGENKLDEAIEVYLKSIELGENSNVMIVNNYAHDIGRVIILYGKTKQKDKLKVFLEDKINMHPECSDVKDWAVRLSKLRGIQKSKPITLSPNDILPQKISNPTLGKQVDDFKKKMPEFNFYYDMQEGSETISYNSNVPFEMSKKLGEYRQAFEIIKSLAKIAENEGDYKTAIEAYERMITEEYEGAKPYERLIILYSKLKWKDQEISVLERAITFFTRLKEKQLDYVTRLAEKYGMTQKALEYINNDKKIFYYGGAFELYNPQVTRLKKWKERLNKLNRKSEKT